MTKPQTFSAPQTFVDQSANDLYLSLTYGQLDLRPYQILWEAHQVIGHSFVVSRIIGASHIVSVYHNGKELHEMLACVAPKSVSYVSEKIGHRSHHEMRSTIDGFDYRFNSMKYLWECGEPDALQRLEEDATSHAAGSLSHVWNFPQGKLPAVPKTIVHVVPFGAEGIVVETAHSYPGDAVVMSMTSIQFTK